MRKEERSGVLDQFIEELHMELEEDHDSEEYMHEVYQKLGLSKSKRPVESWSDKAEALTIINNLIGERSHSDRMQLERELQSQFEGTFRKAKDAVGKPSYIYVNEFDEDEQIDGMPSQTNLHKLVQGVLRLKVRVSRVSSYIASSQLFETLTLLVIIVNTVYLAINDPNSTQNSDLAIDIFFNVFYCIEFVLKVFSYGLIFNKNAYLRDSWNVLDFIIIVTSLLPYVITVNVSLKPLRIFRVLRPLRTITKIKQLKEIVTTLFEAKSLIIDSVIIMLAFVLMFGIVGLNFFAGVMKHRCIQLSSGRTFGELCGGSSRECGQGWVCGRVVGNFIDEQNFDTFPWGMLMVYLGVTTQAWSQVMTLLMRSTSYFSLFYYVPIILIGNYMLINLTIAIINFKFHEVHHDSTVRVSDQNEPERWDVERIKQLVFNYCNLYYDRISNLHKSGLLYDKSVVFAGKRVSVGIRPQPRKGRLVVDQSCKHARSHIIRSVKVQTEKRNIDDPIVEERTSTRRLSKLRKHSTNVKLKFFGEDSQQLLKKLQFQPIILRPVLKVVPQRSSLQYDESSLSQNSIKTEQLIEQAKLEGQGREERNRKRRMNQLRKLIADLKLRSSDQAIKQEPGQEFVKIDFSDIDPEQLERNYKKMFSESAAQRALLAENKKQAVELPKFIEERDSFPEQSEPIKVVSEFDKSMNLLREANLLSEKQLKIRVKDQEELSKCSSFHYRSILLNEQRKREEVKQKALLGKSERNCVYKLCYADLKIDVQQSRREEYELRLPEYQLHHQSRNQRVVDEASGEHLNAQASSKRVLLKQGSEAKVQEESNPLVQAANKTQEEGFKKRKLKLNENLNRRNKYFKQPQILGIFVECSNEEKLAKVEEGSQSKVSQDYARLRQKEVDPQGQVQISQDMSFEVLEGIPGSLPPSLNVITERYLVYMRRFVGVLVYLQSRLKLVMFHPAVDNLMITLVIANTVVLSLNGLVDSNNAYLSFLNIFFTFAFTADCSLKILAIGLDYFKEIMNNFDVVIVVLSLYDLAANGFTSTTSKYTAFRSIRIFRAFRVFRITRFIRQLKYMQVIMSVINATISQFIYILLLLLIFLYIYSLLGRQIFIGLITPTVYPRQNFNTFQDSFFSSFNLLTASNWNDVWTNIYLMPISGSSYVASIYCISWIFIGNYCLLNLFLAILLDGFGGGNSEQLNEEVHQLQNDMQVIEATSIFQDPSLSLPNKSSRRTRSKSKYIKTSRQKQESMVVTSHAGVRSKPLKKAKHESKCEASYFLFTKRNPLRMKCVSLLEWKYNQIIWQVAIFFSTAVLIFNTYQSSNSPASLAQISTKLNIFITVFFITETLIKSIALGLCLDEGSYLRDNWSKLDFVIVIFSVLDLAIQSVNLSFIKIMRALRPLRLISSSISMRIIVSALMESVSGILNVGFLIFLVLLMFTILMVNLLSGNLYYCSASSYGLYSIYNFSQQDCTAAFLPGAIWQIRAQNFENVGRGLFSLYVMMAKEDFPTYFYQWVDNGAITPSQNGSFLIFLAVSFVFIFVCSFFLMNLVVGVIFLNYHIAEQKLKPKELTDAQECWIVLQQLIAQTRPSLQTQIKPAQPIMRWFFNLVNNFYFQQLINLVIILNIIQLCLLYDDQPLSFQNSVYLFSIFVGIVFIIETICKLIAFGLCTFFKSPSNVFDLLLNVLFLFDFLDYILPQNFSNDLIRTLPSVFRIMRVARLIRIVNSYTWLAGVKKLIQTLAFAIPALLNTLALLFLTLALYAILGAFLFGEMTYFTSFNNDVFNFADFHSALLAMFVWASGQNWYYCAYDTMASTGYAALIYWLSFETIVPQMLIQLFVLVMLDQFESNFVRENNPKTMFIAMEEDFTQQWVRLSQKGLGKRIEERKIIDLYLNLRLPLGFNFESSLAALESQLEKSGIQPFKIKMQLYESKLRMKKQASRQIIEMKLTTNEGFICYNELFYQIAKRRFCPTDYATPQQQDRLKEAADKAYIQIEQRRNEDDNKESMAKKKDVNPLIRMLFSQMAITAWARFAQKRARLEEQSEEDLEPLFLKGQSSRLREKSKYLLSAANLPDEVKFVPVPDTLKYQQGFLQI